MLFEYININQADFEENHCNLELNVILYHELQNFLMCKYGNI